MHARFLAVLCLALLPVRRARAARGLQRAADRRRQGRHLGAHAERGGRPDAPHRARHPERRRRRPRLGRRQDRDRGGEALRRARARRRVQRRPRRDQPAQRADRRRRRPRPVRAGRHLRRRLPRRDGRDAVPPHLAQPEAAAEAARHEAGHARRVARVPHGRLGARRDPPSRARARSTSGSYRRRWPAAGGSTSATARRSSSRSTSATSASRARCPAAAAAPQLQGVRLGGSEIRLAVAGAGGERALIGRVDGDRIEGAERGWSAVRLKPG